MNAWPWIVFGVLNLLTLVWYFLIRRDVLNYMETQLKVLGEGNRRFFDTRRLKGLRWAYALLLVFLMGGFSVFLFSFYA